MANAADLRTLHAIGITTNDGLGPPSTVLGRVSFAMDPITEPDGVGGTVVQIGTNDESDPGRDYEGSVRVVWAFDVFNDVLGSSSLDTHIDAAEHADITVHQHGQESSQGQFISVLASNDEICITQVANRQKAAKMPNGGSTWTWTGDIGATCGQAWEYGMVQKGHTESGDLYYPRCVWMDTDEGRDIDIDPVPITNRQMKIDIFAYGGKTGAHSQDYYCGATIFSWLHADPIEERPSEGYCCPACLTCKENQVKRSLAADEIQPLRRPRNRNQRSAERLIVNSRPQQSAIALCNSPTSRGSDFASTNEGLFCDMETKTLYPICSAETTELCFDLEARHPYLREAGKVRRRSAVSRKYNKISHWD
ncbi:hypothetical protein LTR37_004085 [Vermiconidia calcicola]|uniref:Uncharacterized protein n=1 Tax=Vermiconidia calcicola TaxID=1690605 RepID=A0ACC3NNG9_9PEZI|nr:hypothetical protein LTR37_004085 [Vermiconidia calcicola]